ncbi:MAG: hypothetical protein FWC51_03815 [Proteobacteria bacterium]|nr:hypothetical protein [Pseudomonadota bacterium]
MRTVIKTKYETGDTIKWDREGVPVNPEDFIVKQYAKVIGAYGLRLGKWVLNNIDILCTIGFLIWAFSMGSQESILEAKMPHMSAADYAKADAALTKELGTATLGFFGSLFIAAYRRSADFKESVHQLMASAKQRLSAALNTKANESK